MLTHGDDRALVDAGALVGAGEFGQGVILDLAVVIADRNAVGTDAGHGALALRLDTDLGVHGTLLLDAGGDDRRLRYHQRHRLTLHIRTHQGTVCVVVLQEGDECRRDGGHHLGRNVEVVDHLAVNGDDLVAVAAGDAGVEQHTVLIDRLLRLRDMVVILDVGSHVLHLVGDAGADVLAVLVVDSLDLAVRRLNEAVLVDLREACQIVNQADVRTFRRLNRAHTTVVAVVNVADVEGGALTAQTAGTERGKAALVGQLGKGVILVHELRQRGGAEELLDDRRHGTNVNQVLRGNGVEVLHRHALADYALKTGKADTELVLQQLAHAAQTAVAQMVDVVRRPHAAGNAVEIIDRRENIVMGNVLRNQLVPTLLDRLLPAVGGNGIEHLKQDAAADLFLNAVLRGVEIDEALHVHHEVREKLAALAADGNDRLADAAGGQLLGFGSVEHLAGHGKDLSGARVGDRLGKLLTAQAAPQVELLVEFIASDLGYIVAAGVKEQTVQISLGILNRGRLTRAQAAINLQQAVLAGLAGVLFQRRHDALVLAEQLQNLPVLLHAEGADEAGDGELAVLIDTDVEAVLQVGFVFQPCAAVRNDRRGVDVLVRLVHGVAVVHAGRAYDLRNNDALGAVDYKRAAVGHQREIAHKDFLILDLAGLLVEQAHANLDGLGIGRVALLALLYGVLRLFVEGVVEERQLKISGVVGDCSHVTEYLAQPLVEEPVVGILLNFQEVWHLQQLLILRVALTLRLAELHVMNLHIGSSQPFSNMGCVLHKIGGAGALPQNDTLGCVGNLSVSSLAIAPPPWYNAVTMVEKCAWQYSRSLGDYYSTSFFLRQ